MRKLANGLVLAIACIVIISSMPAVLAATSLGGTSATAQHGGGAISGASTIFAGHTITQFGDVIDDTSPGARFLVAAIQSEVEVPEGQTGDAKVSWNVPASSQSTQSVTVAPTTTELGYTLTVSADGITSASVEKTSSAGVAYSLAQIFTWARMDTDDVGSTGLMGLAQIASAGLLTGTGTISSTAKGAASFDATAQSTLNPSATVTSPYDVSTSGSIVGATTLNAENTKDGYIGKFADAPGLAGVAMTISTIANPVTDWDPLDVHPSAQVTYFNQVFLPASRKVSGTSGTTTAIGSAAGTSKGKADTAGSSAGVGCNEPITADLIGTVSAPARGDFASSQTDFQVESTAVTGTSADAHANLMTDSLSQRTATCCDNGEITLATSQIVNAVWDATAVTDSGQGDIWQACIDGATGMTRDGSITPTEPGYAAGATSLNRKGMLESTISTYQGASADAGGLIINSDTRMDLSGPAYTPTSSIEDAVGSRFAIDKMNMIASSGIGDGQTLETNIAGPDAFLWITGDNAQTLNGHFATDAYSIWDVAFDPANTGTTSGPDLNVISASFPREVKLQYQTKQP